MLSIKYTAHGVGDSGVFLSCGKLGSVRRPRVRWQAVKTSAVVPFSLT